MKFHNGKEMTAEDVKATFERAMYTESGLCVTEIVKMFTSVDVVDTYTVSITTDEPYGPMESLLCNMSLAIMDADYIEKYGLEISTNPEAENGTGCFKLVSWDRDSEIVVERFDDYFGTPAKLKKVVYTVIPEAASRTIALETGEDSLFSQSLMLMETCRTFTTASGYYGSFTTENKDYAFDQCAALLVYAKAK